MSSNTFTASISSKPKVPIPQPPSFSPPTKNIPAPSQKYTDPSQKYTDHGIIHVPFNGDTRKSDVQVIAQVPEPSGLEYYFGSFGWKKIVIIGIIILVLCIAGYYLYKKFSKVEDIPIQRVTQLEENITALAQQVEDLHKKVESIKVETITPKKSSPKNARGLISQIMQESNDSD